MVNHTLSNQFIKDVLMYILTSKKIDKKMWKFLNSKKIVNMSNNVEIKDKIFVVCGENSFNLNDNEKLLFIDCISAVHQKVGHVGVSGPISYRTKTIKSAEEWLETKLDSPYINITANIQVVSEENGCTTIANRYVTLYSKDEWFIKERFYY